MFGGLFNEEVEEDQIQKFEEQREKDKQIEETEQMMERKRR